VAITEFFVAGHATGLLDARRRQRIIDTLDDHYLICGFGRVGRQVARDLRAAGASYAVIDPNPESLRPAEEAGIPCVEAEASDAAVLREPNRPRERHRLRRLDAETSSSPQRTQTGSHHRGSGGARRIGTKAPAGGPTGSSRHTSQADRHGAAALHPQVADVVDVAPSTDWKRSK
jgi:voltage-gated potassium channel